MRDLLIPGQTILFTGSECNHQSTLALDAIARAVGEGAAVIALTETAGEGDVFKARVRLLLPAYGHNPSHNDAVAVLPGYREYNDGEKLAVAIDKRLKTLPVDEDFPITRTIIFYDGAAEMQPVRPDATIFEALIDARCLLPHGTAALATSHTGSPFLPQQFLAEHPFDRVYEIKSPGVALAMQVSQHKPTREKPFTRRGIVHDGGSITFEEVELVGGENV